MKRLLFLLIFVGGMGVGTRAMAKSVSVEGVVLSAPAPECGVVQVDQVEQVVCGREKDWKRVKVGERVRVVGEKDAYTAVLAVTKTTRQGKSSIVSARAPVAVWKGVWLGVRSNKTQVPAIAEVLVADKIQAVEVGTDTILNSRFGLLTLAGIADGDQVTIVAERAGEGWHARLVHNQTVETDQASVVGVIEGIYLSPRPTLRLAMNGVTRDVYYFDQTRFLRGRAAADLRNTILAGSRVVVRGRSLSHNELLATHVWLLP